MTITEADLRLLAERIRYRARNVADYDDERRVLLRKAIEEVADAIDDWLTYDERAEPDK